MRRRRWWTRLDLRIPREVVAGFLLLAALFALCRGMTNAAADIIEEEDAVIPPAQTASALWPSRGDADGARTAVDRRENPEPTASDNKTSQPMTVFVYNDSKKKIEPMDLEEYIYHVVAAEVPAAYRPEAIRAQAVAARTYALYGVEHGGCSKGADVCTSSAHCQAYSTDVELKERWGNDYAALSQKIREAVESTRGEVVTYDGEPIHALFHAVSGGRTEDALSVFNMNLPYLKSVVSGGEEDAPKYKQTFTFTRERLAKLLNGDYAKAKVAAAKLQGQIEIKERLKSGQVAGVRVGNITITGREFRKSTGIASANFSIGYTDDKVYIYTTGYGHGVGMSQAGANAMATAGKDYREILSHYYTDTKLEIYAPG